MRTSGFLLALLIGLVLGRSMPTVAQQPPRLPPPTGVPILTLEHAGPHAPITTLAFAPDASSLYVAGFDKQVRRYTLRKGKYEADGSFRTPIGSGNLGVVNSIAVSPDGKWVAVGGRAPARGEVWGVADDGITSDPKFWSADLKEDVGVVYLFDPTNPRGGKVIRGQQSEVRSLAFANPQPAGGAVLVTAGPEWDANQNKSGVLRVFDVTTGKETGKLTGLPTTNFPPGLAAWPIGPGNKDVRVAVAWRRADGNPEELLVWDVGNKAAKPFPETTAMGPLAVRTGKAGATEVITAGFTGTTGQLTIRPADPIADAKPTPFNAAVYPLAVTAFPADGGDGLAVIVATGKTTRQLHVSVPKNAPAPIDLANLVSEHPQLAASANGQFLAVAGFADNRVEVYNTAKLGEKPQLLSGTVGGFSKVAFLEGRKVWLGNGTQSTENGGLVLDLDTRAATANSGKEKLDTPPPTGDSIAKVAGKLNEFVVIVNGKGKFLTLRPGEVPTAWQLLPGAPAWDKTLPPIVAIAHEEPANALTLVSLFDASNGERLFTLAGPTLPIRTLAFSGTRPLLAAAGDDGTITVWSLLRLRERNAAIEGLELIDNNGVQVSSVVPGTPAAAKLQAKDTIEAVGPENGKLKAVKTGTDVVLAIRELKPGDNAAIKLKGQAAPVVVKVGTGIGFRQPLMTLWVNPDPNAANAGKHDWIGWTQLGPYDTSGEAAEDRMVWLTTTGNENEPVTFAPAKKYRDDLHKDGLLKHVIDTADVLEALKRQKPPVEEATLAATLVASIEQPDGRPITREKATEFEVRLSDPSKTIRLTNQSKLRWRPVARDGTPGEWRTRDFTALSGRIPFDGYEWTRGDHRFQIALHPDPNAVAAVGTTLDAAYVPPRPKLAVQLDGKAVPSGSALSTLNKSVQLTAVVMADNGADGAVVTLGEGKNAQELKPNAMGKYEIEVPLPADATTAIRVVAINKGATDTAALESDDYGVTIQQIPPKAEPPPTVHLRLVTPHERSAAPGNPLVTRRKAVTVEVTVRDPNEIEAIEWIIGDNKAAAGKLVPVSYLGFPLFHTETRPLELPAKGDPLPVLVRAKSKNSPVAEKSLLAAYASLPDTRINVKNATVTGPEAELSGPLEGVGDLPFTMKLVVTSVRTGQFHAEEVANPAPPTWQRSVSLYPGENRISVVLANRWTEAVKPAAVIRYIRPPSVLVAPPVEAGTGFVGDVAVTVATPAGLPPLSVWVNGSQKGISAGRKLGTIFGLDLWALKVEAVSFKNGVGRLKAVPVVVRNAEGESQPVSVEVRGGKEAASRPPTLVLVRDGAAIGPGQAVRTDDARFNFEVRARADSPLRNVEVWHGGVGGGMDAVPNLKIPAAAKEAVLNVAGLELQPGVNRVRVVVTDSADRTETEFLVGYIQPAVRVELDAILENGKPLVFSKSRGEIVKPNGPVVTVRGRVVWDNPSDPIARDPHLAVVFRANGVTHLPVLVDQVAGKQERAFAGEVYLNALDLVNPGMTRVQIDLRTGSRLGSVPQQGRGQAEVTLQSANPLRKQRMHLLIVGLEVPKDERAELVRRVVKAAGGELRPRTLEDQGGEFDRPGFERAILYRPLFASANRDGVIGLLSEVNLAISRMSVRPDEKWVNDVIVVYYQGSDFVEGGRRILHTSLSLTYARGGAPSSSTVNHAVRIDDLPPISGWPLAVLNVADQMAWPTDGETFAAALARFRCSWANPAASAQLLPVVEQAVRGERSVDEVIRWVQQEVRRLPQRSGESTDTIPREYRGREIGLGRP